jgi:hypothetical protein
MMKSAITGNNLLLNKWENVMGKDQEYDALLDFFNTIGLMTIRHSVLNDRAVVYCDELGKALRKVDKKWYQD